MKNDHVSFQKEIAEIVNRNSNEKIIMGIDAGDAYEAILNLLKKWEPIVRSSPEGGHGDFTD